MAITGIDTIEGKQIIAAGAVSAKSAEMAYNDENGNPITGYLTAVPESSLSGYIPYSAYGISLINSNFSIDINGQAYKSSAGQPDQQINVTYSVGNMYLNDNNDGLALQAGKYEFRVTLSGVNSLKITTALGTEIIEVVNGIGVWNLATDYTTRFWSDSVIPYESNDGTGTRLYFYSSADATLWYITSEVTNKPYALIDDISGKQDITGMTAYQPVGNYQTAGDYLTTAASANFYTTANESGFITGVDLTPYQEKADMTAYATVESLTAKQDAGDYLSATDSANFLLTSDSANFYTTANESGFISEVPAGTMNESAFEYDANDKISGYNGSAFAGGSEVPEGVMVESGLEYNAVNEISAYNGSAIAQYGAEKQWLVHDDTLVHASNSAQYALGVNLSAVAQLLGIDETVLWEGSAPLDQSCLVNGTRETATLSEPLSSFNKIRIYAVWNTYLGNFEGCSTFEYPGTNIKGGYIMNDCTNQGFIAGGIWSANGTTFKLIKHWQAQYPGVKDASTNYGGIFKVVGIGRKA